MPTAEQFRLAATRFDDVAGEIAATGRAVDRSGAAESVTGEHRVAGTIGVALDAAGWHATQASSACEQLADECRRRADECDAYDDALEAYRSANAAWWTQRRRWLEAQRDDLPDNIVWSLHPGSRPVSPTPPAFYGSSGGACA